MNLYRIDTPKGPVCDLLGPRLIRSYRVACDVARDTVSPTCDWARLTRISGPGHCRVIRTYVHKGRYA